jgi:hypothetical protein
MTRQVCYKFVSIKQKKVFGLAVKLGSKHTTLDNNGTKALFISIGAYVDQLWLLQELNTIIVLYI